MATSGTVIRSEEKSKKRLRAESKSKTEDLIANLGRNMGSVMEEYESEKARLKSEKEKFQRELGLAQEQSESWYLGKNVAKAHDFTMGKYKEAFGKVKGMTAWGQ